MRTVQFENGIVEIDAAVIADGLGIEPSMLRKDMQAGRITSVCERGIDADDGRHRITFFSAHRRFRLVIDQRGAIVQRSTLNFGDAPLPASAHSNR